MSYDKGFDFRGTAAYVTDPANCVPVLATTAYDIGQGYGWTTTTGLDARNKNDAIDARQAGFCFTGPATVDTFQVDLPAAGSYDIALGMGSAAGGDAINSHVSFYDSDNATLLFAISFSGSQGADQWVDASNNVLTLAAWPTSQVPRTVTVSGTTLYMKLGNASGTGSDTSLVAHVRVTTTPGAGLTAGTVSIASKTDTSVTVSGTACTGGTATYTYQFQRSPDNATWTNVGSAQSGLAAGVAPSNVTDTGLTAGATYYYRYEVTDSAGSPATADAAGVSVTTYSDATTYTLTAPTPASGAVSTASGNFTVAATGYLAASVTVTPSVSGVTGTFSPSSVTLGVGNNSSATFTLTPTSAGTATISVTNDGGLTDPGDASYTVTGVKNVIACLGNSSTYGYSDSATYGPVGNDGAAHTGPTADTSPITTGVSTTYPARLMESIGTTAWDGFVVANNGLLISGMQTLFFDAAGGTQNSNYDASAAYNVVCIFSSIDVVTLTAAQIYSDLQTFAAAARAAGWKVIVLSLLPYGNSTNLATRAAVHALIQNSWRSWCDGYAAWQDDARVGVDAAVATLPNTYYQSDGHPKAACTAVLAPYVAAAVELIQNPGGSSGGSGPTYFAA